MSPHDDERSRLAQVGLDLHDGPLQDAAYLLGHVRALVDEIGAEAAYPLLLDRARGLEHALTELEDGLRRIAASLAEGERLESSLEEVVTRFRERTPVTITVAVDDTGELPPAVREALAHVCAEALENARRHSGATRVAVSLRATTGGCELVVSDDGRGFDPSSPTGRLGVRGMHERMRLCGGRLAIESAPGCGTTVTASYSC